MILLITLLAAGPLLATSVAGSGSWQSFPVATLNEDGTPYWDNQSTDGSHLNIGKYLSGTGGTFPQPSQSPTPDWWGNSDGSADITVDATAGSVIIDGGEAVADAVIIRATGAAGGIDITSLADIDITTTGTAGEDISLTNTGGSINLSATEAIADATTIESTAGGVDITSAATFDIDITATLGTVQIIPSEAAHFDDGRGTRGF